MAAIRRNPAAVGQDRLDTVKDRLDTVKDRLEIVGEGPTRNRGRGTRSKSSWPGVSRPPAPSRRGRRGGCTTANAWVAGTRPAMTERA